MTETNAILEIRQYRTLIGAKTLISSLARKSSYMRATNDAANVAVIESDPAECCIRESTIKLVKYGRYSWRAGRL
jgi:hypothetical protein